MLVIVDYGVGNLGSVRNMLKKAGFDSVISSDSLIVGNAEKIILPGIGAFDHCMVQFNRSGLKEIVSRRVLEDKIPILGICVGLQMFMEKSEEGSESGLGWIKGQTIKFKKDKLTDLKVPHMGWSNVRVEKQSPIIQSLGIEPRFYFVHSYHVQPTDASDVLLTANYGYDFTAAIGRENIYGVQFHPEKSHKYGMAILGNFANL